jgi:hypothetical protein
MRSVYSAVRTGSLNKAVCASYLDGLNYVLSCLKIVYRPQHVACITEWNKIAFDGEIYINMDLLKYIGMNSIKITRQAIKFERAVVISTVLENLTAVIW